MMGPLAVRFTSKLARFLIEPNPRREELLITYARKGGVVHKKKKNKRGWEKHPYNWGRMGLRWLEFCK